MERNASRLGYDDPAMLRSGDEVDLVAVEEADFEPDPAEQTSVPYVLVESGDSYWEIAAETLGDDATPQDVLELTTDLMDLNSPMLGYDVRPMIHPGDVVFLQDPSTIPPPPAPVPDAPDPDPTAVGDFVDLVQTVGADVNETPTASDPTTSAPPTSVAHPTISTPSSTVLPGIPDGQATDAETSSPSQSPVGVGEAALPRPASLPCWRQSAEHGCELPNRRRACRSLVPRPRRPSRCCASWTTANACSASTSRCGRRLLSWREPTTASSPCAPRPTARSS